MSKFNKDSSFVVKDSMAMNGLISAVFFAMFIFSLFDDGFSWDAVMRFKGMYFVLIPAVYFLIKALLNRTCIVINSKGIFHYGRLITNWDHFIEATVDHIDIPGRIGDNFVLVIVYTEENKTIRITLKLNNTYNKSEEDIIEAIKYFSINKPVAQPVV